MELFPENCGELDGDAEQRRHGHVVGHFREMELQDAHDLARVVDQELEAEAVLANLVVEPLERRRRVQFGGG